MLVLLDNCVDQRFGSLLPEHHVVHARARGWAFLENGTLIAQAEAHGFQAMVTVDKNLRYQQNIAGRKISILILETPRITYRHIAPLADKVSAALRQMAEGSYIIIGS